MERPAGRREGIDTQFSGGSRCIDRCDPNHARIHAKGVKIRKFLRGSLGATVVKKVKRGG